MAETCLAQTNGRKGRREEEGSAKDEQCYRHSNVKNAILRIGENLAVPYWERAMLTFDCSSKAGDDCLCVSKQKGLEQQQRQWLHPSHGCFRARNHQEMFSTKNVQALLLSFNIL